MNEVGAGLSAIVTGRLMVARHSHVAHESQAKSLLIRSVVQIGDKWQTKQEEDVGSMER